MLKGVHDELQTDQVCGNEPLKNRKQQNVLGGTTDKKVNLATHLVNITRSANSRFNA